MSTDLRTTGRSERSRLLQAWLADRLARQDLPNYVYAYPSKRAYRPMPAEATLRRIWSETRPQDALNVYLHIPFCNYRCSFCTLFVTTADREDIRRRYTRAVCDEIAMYGELVPQVGTDSLYLGGGTPTTMQLDQTEQLLDAVRAHLPPLHHDAEISIEGSPDTFTAELSAGLRDQGFTRASLGVQTLVPQELHDLGRPYPADLALRSLASIQDAGFTSTNVDLIYGLENQTMASWLTSLRLVLEMRPTTLTLYPVVFRPLTVINARASSATNRFAADALKYEMYDEARALLVDLGYRQESVVRFTSLAGERGYWQERSDFSGNPLLGLGAGSRSYAGRTHYATEFPVRMQAATEAVSSYIATPVDADRPPALGVRLDDDEAARRYLILNLSLGHVDEASMFQRVGRGFDAYDDELQALVAEGLVEPLEPGRLGLTRNGFRYSSLCLEFLTSPAVQELERGFRHH
jgi:oxygen-independent coproporphyrinogen-3 oxidase